jgi:two-component system, cell cycle sensor histidine kinase and response regulator CckA
MSALSNAWRVTAVYTVFGVAWILFSDQAVNNLFPIEVAVKVQTVKGLIYILLTALLVFWLVNRADRSLLRSEARYRGLFEGSPDATYVIGPDGRLLDANPVALGRYRYTKEEFTRLTIADLAAPGVQTQLPERLRQAYKTGSQFEWKHVRKDGTEIDVEINTCPVTLDGEQYILAIARDITERKRAEEERERLSEQLRQAQKMEAVGQLAGGVAHDFNNLLQVINGHAEMLLSELPKTDAARTSAADIAEAGKRAATLVSQLLAFSRRQVLKLENLDLNSVVGGFLKMIERVIGEHVRINFVPGFRLGSVHADRGQIEQVIMNLCVNARDAMPEGGQLTIETQNVVIDQEYCALHSWASPGRYVLLSVTDTGHGMDAETRERIWEPFFTTKEIGHGTGLGLSTVYGIVRQHDGMIQVYSEPDKGTLFKVYFPMTEASATSLGSKIEGPVPTGTETVLLVEDDINVRNLCRRILEKGGYAVLTASDGEEAIGICDARGRDIDLALLDVVLPKLGGKAVYERVKDQYPRMRFIFASGYSANAVHTGFVLHEGVQLIQKPFTPEQLLRQVREVLDA